MQTLANQSFFAVQYVGMTDMWMNDGGNLQSQIGARFFETREDAQTFLDTRRLRRGFRASLAVSPVAVETIRDLAATALHYSTLPALPARDDRKEWADRAAVLAALLPLTVH